MKWWYENEEEKMKLYKNEDLCIECKNAFFSKPYDHRDPTPGLLGYCIKCDNFLIKDKKMEFLRERVYTSLNADELKAGDKVIVGGSLLELKDNVRQGRRCGEIVNIEGESYTGRFQCVGVDDRGLTYWELAYLVERKENCTNCEYSNLHNNLLYCDDDKIPIIIGGEKLSVCSKYKPKTKKKAEKHYRPFKDTAELMCHWYNKIGGCDIYDKLTMPLIWVKNKERGSQELIIAYNGDMFLTEYAQGDMEKLLEWYTFLDGSPCGVEE